MKNQATKSGLSVVTILGLIFVTLKLTGHINWSWWLVTLPFWGGFALVIGIVIIFGLIVLAVNSKKLKTPTKPKNFIPKRSKFQERMEEAQRLNAEAKRKSYEKR